MLKKIAVLAVSIVLSTGCRVSAESIFYSTGKVNPGETAMICGSGLSGITSVSVSRLEDEAGSVPAYIDKALPDRPNTMTPGASTPVFNSENFVNTAVIQPSDTSIKFEISQGQDFGVYSVKVGCISIVLTLHGLWEIWVIMPRRTERFVYLARI